MEAFMKKFLITVVFGLVTAGAQAGGHHGHHGHHHGNGWGWVAPALISGVVVYAATRPPVVVQQPTVIQPVPQPIYTAPMGYRWETVLDANCNCYRNVLIPN